MKSDTLCIAFIRLSLEAKPEEHSEDEKMKPVLEALAELKEDISPEEAIAAVKWVVTRADRREVADTVFVVVVVVVVYVDDITMVFNVMFPATCSLSMHIIYLTSSSVRLINIFWLCIH